MSKEIIPNRAFAAVLAESGLSNKRLARLVGEASRARGKREVRSDHVAVGRWLDGGQPQTEAAECIAAVLSQTLKRAVTPAALGFTERRAARGLRRRRCRATSRTRPTRSPPLRACVP